MHRLHIGLSIRLRLRNSVRIGEHLRSVAVGACCNLYQASDTCADRRADMCVGMCVQGCRHSVDVCSDMCADMRADMHTELCFGSGGHMCSDVCTELGIGPSSCKDSGVKGHSTSVQVKRKTLQRHGSRVSGLGSRVSGLGSRVSGRGSRGVFLHLGRSER